MGRKVFTHLNIKQLAIFLCLLAGCLLVYAQVSDKSKKARHIAVLGDSITWLGGDDCTKPRGWTKWFAEEYRPARIRSYARSGATMTNTTATREDTELDTGVLHDSNVLHNQVLRLIRDAQDTTQAPDLIIIAVGANDAWFEDKRPGLFNCSPDSAFATPLTTHDPAEATTLTRAARLNISMLQQALPKARIVLLTPFESASIPPDRITRVGDMLTAVARKMNVDVVRLDSLSPVRAASERRKRTYTYDGTHTSERGARANARVILQALDSIYNL